LGTSFNVSAYPGTEIVEVIVKSGKVQVLKQLDNFLSVNNVILTAGEKVTSFKHSNKLQKEINNDPNFIAWKTHNLVFNDSPLEYVIQKLEKTYHVEIQISDSGINNLILSAHFNDKPIDFILEVIRLTFNLELLVENDSYILTSRNS
jgi:ferric-dicitrate binding protein FerR (iron transport regulator)